MYNDEYGHLQTELGSYLQNRSDGKVITECSVETTKGVKVADVAWGSDGFFQENGLETPYQQAPEVCVEISSPSNTEGEIQEKIGLYLARGAVEVWVCDEDGVVKFYSYKGELAGSKIFPNAPRSIEIAVGGSRGRERV